MARVFNGVIHYTSAEMEERTGESKAMWRHYARTNKVPAKRWIDGHWYFNPEEVESAGKNNGYADETGNNTDC